MNNPLHFLRKIQRRDEKVDREGHSDESPLSINDLTVAYHQKPVVWDIDLDLPEGKLIGLIGPNGAGKSTLLKACLGLIPTTSGDVRFYGGSYEEKRDIVGYVPQRESVDWDFPVTVLDVVAMGTYRQLGWCRPVNRRSLALAEQALEQVGLSDYRKRQISQLSGGQQQRVFLARALAQNSSIYFMDEPFAAVDASTEESIIQLLHELKAKGKTCIVVHHDLSTVPQYFDWVVMMNMRIVASGPTEKVFTQENLQKTYGGKLSILSEAVDQAKSMLRR